MREPQIELNYGAEDWVPYSRAPSHMLRGEGIARGEYVGDQPEFFDRAFRLMYAAILLRERGL